MKNVLAISAIFLAATSSVFAQDTSSILSTDALATSSAAPTDSASLSSSDSAAAASSTQATDSASVTDSASSSLASASASGSASSSSSASADAALLATTATTSYNPIPTGTGISSACSTFMNQLDSDSTLASCTAPLLNATSAFAPGANSATQSTATLISTLNTLCAAKGCTDSSVRTLLTKFYSACKAELTGSTAVSSVKDTYDILYVMQPLKVSICSKDGSDYCVLKTPSNSTSSAPSSSTTTTGTAGVQNLAVSASSADSDAQLVSDAVDAFYSSGIIKTGSIQRRGETKSKSNSTSSTSTSDQTVMQYAPDTQVYHDTGVMYLYTLPGMSADSLCTTCTKNVLAAYASWESKTLYGPGLSSSPMLGDQAALWSAAKTKCGTSFVAAVQSAAGSSSSNSNQSGAMPGVSSSVGGLVTVFVALLGVFVAF